MSVLLQRTPCRIRPDASPTLCRLFVPGQETLMSLRAVGEGHMSSIEFRTGTIGEPGIRLDQPGRFPDTGRALPVPHDRDLFQAKLADLVAEDENARLLRDLLPSRFTTAELNMALAELPSSG